jgi:hypothetical protein
MATIRRSSVAGGQPLGSGSRAHRSSSAGRGTQAVVGADYSVAASASGTDQDAAQDPVDALGQPTAPLGAATTTAEHHEDDAPVLGAPAAAAPLAAGPLPLLTAAQPAAILELFAAHTDMVAQANHIVIQHGAGHPAFLQACAAYGNALPTAGIGALIEQQFQQQQVNINNSINAAIQPMAAKVDALYADYTERHNANCFHENSRVRSRRDQVKWPFQEDGTLPKLPGDPPRLLPNNVEQLDDLVEADLDALNGGYKVALIPVPGSDLDRKLASLKYFLKISV